MQDSLTAIITMPGAIITTPAICPAKEYVTPSLMRMTSVGYCEGRYRHRRCSTPLRIHGKLKEDSLDGSSFLYREKGTHLPLKVDLWGWRNVPQNPHGQRTLLCPGQAGRECICYGRDAGRWMGTPEHGTRSRGLILNYGGSNL